MSVFVIPLLAAVIPGDGLWPSALPFLGQLLIAILIADFGITTVHLASHRVWWMWRLHAVHHSIRRSYGLNGLMKHPLHQPWRPSAALLRCCFWACRCTSPRHWPAASRSCCSCSTRTSRTRGSAPIGARAERVPPLPSSEVARSRRCQLRDVHPLGASTGSNRQFRKSRALTPSPCRCRTGSPPPSPRRWTASTGSGAGHASLGYVCLYRRVRVRHWRGPPRRCPVPIDPADQPSKTNATNGKPGKAQPQTFVMQVGACGVSCTAARGRWR
jgi:hypothetical protein